MPHPTVSVQGMKTYRIGVIGLGQRIALCWRAMKEVGWALGLAGYVDPEPVGAPILAAPASPPRRSEPGEALLGAGRTTWS